jgi:hypothetical protein
MVEKTIYLLIVIFLKLNLYGQVAKQPTIMVVPSDNWCFERNYKIQTINKNNQKELYPDYYTALQNDSELYHVVTQIGKMFSDRGFNLKDLKASIDKQRKEKIHKSKLDIESSISPIDELALIAKADIFLKITWNTFNKGPYNSITFTIKAIDAYTNEQIAGATGTGKPCTINNVSVLLKEAVISHIDNLQSQMQSHFNDLIKNGRVISMRILSNDIDLEQTSYYDFIIDWLDVNTVNGVYNEMSSSESEIIFETLRIPIFINNKPIDAKKFGRLLYLDLRKQLKCTARVRQFGLGEVWITIEKGTDIVIETPTNKLSDVDVDIPETKDINNNTFAVIIGNENYTNEIQVKYALNDAKIFYKYATKTLGIPTTQIHLIENATSGTIKGEINWLKEVSKAFNGKANIIFYYAGHGMPDEKTKTAYILPTDGNSKIITTAISTEYLYSELSEHSTFSTLILLDACFSGAAREGMLAGGRAVKIKPKTNILKGNMVVISATTENETAHPYNEKSHGLFTYFLLKHLQKTNGETTIGDLYDYIKKNVMQKSIIVNQKSQTPDINTSYEVKDKWKTWRMK